jgi:hypothetical protein
LLEGRLAPAAIRVTGLGDAAPTALVATGAGTFDAANLRSAVVGANAMAGADTINFQAGLTGTITLTVVGDTAFGRSALLVNSQMTIDGNNGAAGLTITQNAPAVADVPPGMRLFAVTGGGDLTLQSSTLTGSLAQGGNGGAGGATYGGGGGAAGLGGAVFVNNNSFLRVVQSTLFGNTAQGGAGGSGAPAVTAGGGGGGIGGNGGIGGATGGNGGGPNSGAGGTNGTNATTGGFGGGGGGGGTSSSSSAAGGFGGGGGSMGFGGGTGLGGAGGFGGGGGFSGGGSLFGGGTGTGGSGNGGGGGAGMGGAIFNNGGTVTITNSTLSTNTARGGAKGPGNATGGQGLGGGVFNHNGTLVVNNSTIANNQALDSAGAAIAAGGRGIFNLGDGNALAARGNTTGTAAAATINNSIVGQNGPLTATQDFRSTTTAAGTVSNGGVANLIRVASGFTGAFGTADPMLGPLQLNGGRTQTHALTAASLAAIGAGDPAFLQPPTTDQRGAGFNRVINSRVDIGAYEFQPPATTLTLSAAPASPSNLSVPVTFTVTLTGNAPGSNIPQGFVTFTFDGGSPFNVPLDPAGQASFSTTGAQMTGGVHPVTAAYPGNGIGDYVFNGDSESTNHVVVSVTTTTAANAATTFDSADQTALLSATVTASGVAVNEGTVVFQVGAFAPSAPISVVAGAASVNYTIPGGTPAGPYAITATYTGTANYDNSSNTSQLDINRALTTTGVVSSQDPSALAQPVTFTATLTSAAGGPFSGGGTVAFTFDGTPLGGPVPLVGNTATSTATLPPQMTAGAHAVIATYSGDVNYLDGTGTLTQGVSPQGTTTILSPSPDPVPFGQQVALAATVSAGAGFPTPTGTVSFAIDGVGLSPVGLSGGTATLALPFALIVGTHNVIAVYNPSPDYLGSQATQSLVVNVVITTPTAELLPDPLFPATQMLIISGTGGNDNISVKARGVSKTSFNVILNGGPTLLYENVTGRIKVLGNAGNDRITLGGTVTKRTELDGGPGNDTITGGGGIDFITGGPGDDSVTGGANVDYVVEAGDVDMTLTATSLTGLGVDKLVGIERAVLTGGDSANVLNASAFKGSVVLVGGGGADSLTGGSRRDLLIGGLGQDSLAGGAGDDILIGGTTSLDADVAALDSVMREWTRTDTNGTYAKRIGHLRDGTAGGRNGAERLNPSTVFDDAVANSLTGGLNADWFFRGTAPDLLTDLNTGGRETVTSVP